MPDRGEGVVVTRAEATSRIIAFIGVTLNVLVIDSGFVESYFRRNLPIVKVMHEVLQWSVSHGGIVTMGVIILELVRVQKLTEREIVQYNRFRMSSEEDAVQKLIFVTLVHAIVGAVNTALGEESGSDIVFSPELYWSIVVMDVVVFLLIFAITGRAQVHNRRLFNRLIAERETRKTRETPRPPAPAALASVPLPRSAVAARRPVQPLEPRPNDS